MSTITDPGSQERFQPAAGAAQIVLVRHGASVRPSADAPVPRLGLQADPPLHVIGHEEAQRVGARLRHEQIDAIYTSPLTRCRQTAQPLADAIGVEPVVVDDLREVYLGEVDGLDLGSIIGTDDLVRKALREERWELIPGAEPGEVFATRVQAALGDIAQRHPDGTVAVFAHGGVIGQAICLATGATAHSFIRSDNGAITRIVIRRNRWIVRSFNDTWHLSDQPAAGAVTY